MFETSRDAAPALAIAASFALVAFAPATLGADFSVLTRLSDGALPRSFTMEGCGASALFNVTLPFDARVREAGIYVRDDGTADNATGTLSFDVGDDGTVDRLAETAYVNSTSVDPVYLMFDQIALTRAVSYAAQNSSDPTADVDVPIRFVSCLAVSSWNLTITQVAIEYVHGAPALTVPISDIQMLRGESLRKWSGDPSTNLSRHFQWMWNPYSNLPPQYVVRWSVERLDDGQPSASAVTIQNGWKGTPEWAPETLGPNETLEFFNISTDGQWTGSLGFRVKVTDAWNRSAVSNNITLCVKAGAEDACAPAPGTYLPAPASINTGGAPASIVEAGQPTTFEAAFQAPLPPGARVEWYVDGQFAGTGTRLEGAVLDEGVHTVEARAVVGDETQYLRISVKARPPGALGALPMLTDFSEGQRVVILLTLSIVGVLFARSPGARFLVGWTLLGRLAGRARREALLDHFVRGRLYQVIAENPGIHFSELRRRTGVGNGAALYHLSVLEKAGFVRVVVESSKTLFFVTDQPFDREDFGLNDLDKAVIDAVDRSPGISQRDLGRQLGRSPVAVSRTVRRLLGLGFVHTRREGRSVSVFPRPQAPPSPIVRPDEGA